MPKRSNLFQRLIRRIYGQIRPHGATLTESALVRERDSETEREVDILVEVQLADSAIRMAIECRDHDRAADVTWIDQLIGKYRNLAVDRVVAVSRSGFTKAAVRKAASNQIETRTLQEAYDTNWPAELLLVGVARFVANLRPTTCEIISDPAWPDPTPPRQVLVSGCTLSSDEFIQEVVRGLHPEILPFMNAQLGREFNLVTDLDKTHKIKSHVDLLNTTFVSATGTAHEVERLVLDLELTFTYDHLPVKRHLFGRVGITSADDHDIVHGPVTLMVAQQPDDLLGRAVVFKRDSGEDL